MSGFAMAADTKRNFENRILVRISRVFVCIHRSTRPIDLLNWKSSRFVLINALFLLLSQILIFSHKHTVPTGLKSGVNDAFL